MKGSSSAKATMSSKRRSTSTRDNPRIEPLRYTFSRPVSSGWNPAPSSRRAAMRPTVRSRPLVGRRMPAMHFRSVDLPEPLWPSRPTVSPTATSKVTSRSAQKSTAGLRPRRSTRSLSDEVDSRWRRNRLETASTSTAPPISSPPSLASLAALARSVRAGASCAGLRPALSLGRPTGKAGSADVRGGLAPLELPPPGESRPSQFFREVALEATEEPEGDEQDDGGHDAEDGHVAEVPEHRLVGEDARRGGPEAARPASGDLSLAVERP